jgi:hypothetical protein
LGRAGQGVLELIDRGGEWRSVDEVRNFDQVEVFAGAIGGRMGGAIHFGPAVGLLPAFNSTRVIYRRALYRPRQHDDVQEIV